MAKTLARIPIISTLAFIFIISALFSLFWKRDEFFYLQRQLTAEPNNSILYDKAATLLLINNQYQQTEQLLMVLSESQSIETPQNLWQQKHLEDPQDVTSLINRWEEIIKERPDYRDAYLQLAFLHLKLKNYQGAYSSTKKALEIDPHYPPAKEMRTLLDKFGSN